MKMLLARQKWFVMLRSGKGFTFIEMLVSLVIFMIICILSVQIFFTMRENLAKNNGLDLKEWEIFSLQLQNELRNSKDQYGCRK